MLQTLQTRCKHRANTANILTVTRSFAGSILAIGVHSTLPASISCRTISLISADRRRPRMHIWISRTLTCSAPTNDCEQLVGEFASVGLRDLIDDSVGHGLPGLPGQIGGPCHVGDVDGGAVAPAPCGTDSGEPDGDFGTARDVRRRVRLLVQFADLPPGRSRRRRERHRLPMARCPAGIRPWDR